VTYWVKTNVEIVSSTPAHIRWVEQATPVHHLPVLDEPATPHKRVLPTRRSMPSSCRRRIEFDSVAQSTQ
jgi:hypothetical protein